MEPSAPTPSQALQAAQLASVACRAPQAGDGAAMFEVVRATGVLELNSAYAYVMMADLFGATCAIAERGSRVVGCLVGMRPPRTPTALFVWQIGVHPDARRQGIALSMLEHVLSRADNRDINELLTTIGTRNEASEGMFRAFARRHGASIEPVGGYPADFFPAAHEAERMFRIAGL